MSLSALQSNNSLDIIGIRAQRGREINRYLSATQPIAQNLYVVHISIRDHLNGPCLCVVRWLELLSCSCPLFDSTRQARLQLATARVAPVF